MPSSSSAVKQHATKEAQLFYDVLLTVVASITQQASARLPSADPAALPKPVRGLDCCSNRSLWRLCGILSIISPFTDIPVPVRDAPHTPHLQVHLRRSLPLQQPLQLPRLLTPVAVASVAEAVLQLLLLSDLGPQQQPLAAVPAMSPANRPAHSPAGHSSAASAQGWQTAYGHKP